MITVQYGNVSDTAALAESLRGVEGLDGLEMVVVNNMASADGMASLEAVVASAPLPVRTIASPRNLYYWGGAAHALGILSQANDLSYDWVIVCNNDVVIRQRDFLSRLRALDTAKYPIVAPRITLADRGIDQNPLRTTPEGSLSRIMWRVYDSNYRVAQCLLWTRDILTRIPSLQRGLRASDGSEARAAQIYAPHGSMVILSYTFFERGGKLDTTVPMFAEELTIAVTAERLGLPVWYRPELSVIHNANSTTGRSITREKYEFERLSRRHYYSLVAEYESGRLL